MDYYYDILLNFAEYPINYYEWDSVHDDIERMMKIPVIHVSDIKELIAYETMIDTDLDMFIASDGVNSIAIEMIDKRAAYLSCLPYDDELSVNDLAHIMEITPLKITRLKKRIIPFELREERKMQHDFLHVLDTIDHDLLKYIYYDMTEKNCNNIEHIKNYLKKDILTNFNEKYINLYENYVKNN